MKRAFVVAAAAAAGGPDFCLRSFHHCSQYSDVMGGGTLYEKESGGGIAIFVFRVLLSMIRPRPVN